MKDGKLISPSESIHRFTVQLQLQHNSAHDNLVEHV